MWARGGHRTGTALEILLLVGLVMTSPLLGDHDEAGQRVENACCQWLRHEVSQLALCPNMVQVHSLCLLDLLAEESNFRCDVLHPFGGVVAFAEHARRLVVAEYEHRPLVSNVEEGQNRTHGHEHRRAHSGTAASPSIIAKAAVISGEHGVARCFAQRVLDAVPLEG